MKKIVHINPQLEIIGGMERYIEYFYMSFYNYYDIYALSLEKHNINLDIDKKNIFSLNEKINNSIFSKIKKLFIRSKKIATFCENKKIDISISHGDIANIFNIISSFFGNKSKIIIILHNSFDKKTLGIPLYYLCYFFYNHADEIITVSKELTNDVKKILKNNKIKTIYNPFNFDEIKLLKKENIEKDIELLLKNGKINICNVSRIATYKKQDHIIKLFAEYYKINKNIQLFFIGDGDKKYKNFLVHLVKNLGLSDSIFFLGFKQNVYKYINSMDYYYYSGLQEGFGRGLVDALSCGVPILSHDYKYGAKEIIRNNNNLTKCSDIEIHENGILTPYMDKEKYIKSMDIIINTKFDRKKIITNCNKYNILQFRKEWNKILNNK